MHLDWTPNGLGDVVFPNPFSARAINQFVKGRINRLILEGTYGSGKTLLARIIIHERIPDLHWASDVSFINCAKDKTLPDIQRAFDLAKNWPFVNSAGVCPLVIEQPDEMTSGARAAIQALVDELIHFNPAIPIVMSTNFVGKIDSATRNRFVEVAWGDFPIDGMVLRAQYLLARDGIPLPPPQELELLARRSNGSWRKFNQEVSLVV